MFSRPHHQRIAKILESLDADLLKKHNCLFAGGTAIALRYGEYRESVDMDFLVSDLSSYRYLRNLVREQGLQALMRGTGAEQLQTTDIRSDQYGIRTKVFVQGKPIKFEIVLEGRIGLAEPGKKDSILGVATLTKLDMAASKLLANSDRGLDMGMHCRDVIDLAMLNLSKSEFAEATTNTKVAYGEAILKDLSKVIGILGEANGLLERCMKAMDVSVPRALLWQNISKVKSYIANGIPK
ncbi:MAG: nucleotidyl transferase AbiEii/AbiGii toxin family protein [Gammaproteobacteria bacterium]|nr:nucleotidyl transferase AbiEii/AbiGii toxin family protein [Gammaproteobacteria bacterium]